MPGRSLFAIKARSWGGLPSSSYRSPTGSTKTTDLIAAFGQCGKKAIVYRSIEVVGVPGIGELGRTLCCELEPRLGEVAPCISHGAMLRASTFSNNALTRRRAINFASMIQANDKQTHSEDRARNPAPGRPRIADGMSDRCSAHPARGTNGAVNDCALLGGH